MSGTATAAVLPALGLREGRRILLHPVPLGLALASTVPAYLDPAENVSGREVVAGTLAFLFLFLLPVAVIVAANLVASSARRAGADEMLEALPTGKSRRALAMCAGGAGVALVGGAAAVAQYLTSHQGGQVVVESYLTAWEAACVPLMYLGAVAFGVAVARWLPWPGAVVLTVVVLVLWTYTLTDRTGAETTPYLLDSAQWGDNPRTAAISDVWHAAYLACLTALAVVAATFRERPRGLLLAGPALAGAAALLALASAP